MRKVRLIPILLALSMPLTACDIFNPQGQHQKQDVTEIVKVSAPSTIVQNETLAPSKVKLTVKYKDNKTEVVKADRTILNTATLGKTTGTAFYGNVFKDFSITVVSSAVTVTSIDSVQAPPTITQNAQLAVTDVVLNVTYSNNSHGTETPTSVEFDSSNLGVQNGTAYFGDLSKGFTITVVAPETDNVFEGFRNSIINNHNYSFEVESYYQNFPEERFDGEYYNLDNQVFYGTDPEVPNLWKRGYSKIKDQGVVEFVMGQSNEVVVEKFVATNPDLTIYDIDGEVLEYLFEAELSQVGTSHYRLYDQSLVGLVGTYAGLELSYISNPEFIDIRRQEDTILITSILRANYYDESSLEPVENEPVYVGLTVKNIGTTENSVLTEFATSDSSKLVAPTEWDDEMLDNFAEYYKNNVPPFVTGAGYSFCYDAQFNGIEQKYDIMVQDFTSCDLRTSYGSQLEGVGYSHISGSVYEKVINTQGGSKAERYKVEMSYVDPSEPHRGKTFGYFFPQGNFQITYSMTTQVVGNIDTVEKVNTYIASTEASVMAPALPETGAFSSSEVRAFTDNTELANQRGGDWLFLTASGSYFRIYIPSYEDACEFYQEFISNCADKGFNHVEKSAALHLAYVTDFAESRVIVDYVESFTKEQYEAIGYIQCSYAIRNNYDQTFTFDIEKDAGVESIHRLSPTNYFISPGTKVTFSFDLKDGYAFDELVFSDPSIEFQEEEGENTFSFIMPSKNVTVNVKTKTAATDLEFEEEYYVYINNDDRSESSSLHPGHTSQRLSMVFHENGTMTYTRDRFGPSGSHHSGPWSMTVNFTLIDGHFRFEYISGSLSDFDKWRLFTSNVVGSWNDTGTLEEGIITVDVCDSSSNVSTIHLQIGEN